MIEAGDYVEYHDELCRVLYEDGDSTVSVQRLRFDDDGIYPGVLVSQLKKVDIRQTTS